MEIPIKKIEGSSQIYGIGYDYATQTLAIQFWRKDQPGSIYHYANFEPSDLHVLDDVVKGKLEGMSVGQHFTLAIKPFVLKFPYTRIS